MKTHKLLILLLCIFTLSSCATTKYICEEEFDAIENVAIVTPFTDIETIESRDSVVYDVDATEDFSRFIVEGLMASALPTSKYLQMDLEEGRNSNAVLSIKDINPKYADEAQVPRELLNFLKEHDQRYGVFVFANGFLTNNKHYAKELVTGVLLAVVCTVISLGTVTMYDIPEKNSYNMWLAVVDSEKERIVYLNTLSNNGGNATNFKHVSSSVNKLVKDFKKK
ncbi:MAG: hypothetical protein MJZ09_08490 [Bacteroidales bacterium]|nr:hypothetical protein [Bacteroidales bacterium]